MTLNKHPGKGALARLLCAGCGADSLVRAVVAVLAETLFEVHAVCPFCDTPGEPTRLEYV